MTATRRTDVMMVGYFPPTGAVAELFATIACGLAEIVELGVLAPDHLAPVPGAVDFRFPYSSRRPDRALVGGGWRAHRDAASTGPNSTLLFTQHPLNVTAAVHFRRSELALWWHEPASRGQASKMRTTTYAIHDRLVVPRCSRLIVASPSVQASVPVDLRPLTRVVPFPSPAGFDRASRRFTDDPTDLVFFGKLEPYKGLDTLAEALTLLERRGRRPTLRVVGSGDVGAAAPKLRAFSDRREGRVRHVDEYAPGEDVASALRAAQVCVLPYLSAAGSSSIAVTGQQRTALVASTAGSFGDHLIDGRTARLHPPGDASALAVALEEVLSSAQERSRLGDALFELQRERFDVAITSMTLRDALTDDASTVAASETPRPDR